MLDFGYEAYLALSMVQATLQSLAGFKYGKINTADKCPVCSDN